VGLGGSTAPLAARIVRILVRIDEEVSAGQGIAIVEAMKIQNQREMMAPKQASSPQRSNK
jgi:biotin carboxyl carrier protein